MPTQASPHSAAELLAQLVSFDTTSSKSNRACVDAIHDYLSSFGVKNDFGVASEIIPSPDGTKANLWATVGRQDRQGPVLAGHTDVVPVADQTWTSDPFTLVKRNGKLYGRGAVDMKAFLACALAFIPEFLAAKPDACFHLAFTYDEETTLAGALHLIDVLKTRKIKPSWIWLGEPTEHTLIDQHKGVAAYRTTFTGVPVHSSAPDLGLNAIDLMRVWLNAIDDISSKRQRMPVANSRFDPPYTTLNFGIIKGGSAENITAEKCELLWQVRAHPGDTAASIFQNVRDKVMPLVAPRVARFPNAGVETETLFDFDPFNGSADNKAVKALRPHLENTQTRAANFGTEAGVFQRLGADVVVCGPGSMVQAHQTDEFIEESELTRCVDLMRQVLLSSPAQNIQGPLQEEAQ